jgi:hypothetical protein
VNAVAYSPDGHHLATGSIGATQIWDTTTGETAGYRFEQLPEGEVVTWEVPSGTLHRASPGAWRWLGWVLAADGVLQRLPAETFGPLPLYQAASSAG